MTKHGQPNIDLLTFLWLSNNSKDGSTFPVELFLLYIALFLLRGNSRKSSKRIILHGQYGLLILVGMPLVALVGMMRSDMQ
jgi:hypothetical protein